MESINKIPEKDIEEIKQVVEQNADKSAMIDSFNERVHATTQEVSITDNEKKLATEYGGSVEDISKVTMEADKAISTIDHEILELQKTLEQQMNGTQEASLEQKSEFPENHILNPNILDKVAQMEAIDPATGQFSEERYNDYVNNQSKLGNYSVIENQKKAQEGIDMGDDMDMIDFEAIYGVGGMNRYMVDQEGKVHLSRGGDVASGGEVYKTALLNKAKELGIGTN